MRGFVSDIFDEVEEDLRAERARGLLLRYGGLVVGLALAVVAAAGGWQAWRWYDAKRTGQVAEVYLAGMRLAAGVGVGGADRPGAIADFGKVAADGGEGYRTLARLYAAALQADGGDLEGAKASWDQVASDGSADPLLRDLANLMWVTHQLDSGDPPALQARLQPLVEPQNAWHALAQEAQALLAIRRGAPEEAKQTLRALAQDTTAPDGVRGRANGLLVRLGG
jgi:hypothetical protein